MSIKLDDPIHDLSVEELLSMIVKRLDLLIAITEHGVESDIEIGDLENDTT